MKGIVMWDLNGCLVHNNKSLGTGDLPEGYGTPEDAVRAFDADVLPKAYYLTCKDDIVWIDGALDALKMITEAERQQVIITNQEQIGLAIISVSEWTELSLYVDSQIKDAGGYIWDTYTCPHAPGDNCMCRKRSVNPGLRMFYKCAFDLKVNLYDCWMVGDNISDMVSGKAAGCRTIMVKTPKVYPQDMIDKYVDVLADDALEAAEIIVEGKYPDLFQKE